MSVDMKFKRGQVLRVRIEGHSEEVQMVSIERIGMNTGGGLMLIIDRGDVERFVRMLNDGAKAEALRVSDMSAGGARDCDRW